ncbi:MAG: hypothetical protein LBI65_04110 [Candidatus Symbiothrix sp.]|jgi:hypothetical protein|nr:hypothetical protein [Candidatus Symbiothrix sp.]
MDKHWNKNRILSRMIRPAAGYSNPGRPETPDPAVTLFLESLAQEIYRISGEIDDMGKRLLDKLASILIPDENTVAHPAQAILHAVPREPMLEITAETAFTCTSSRREFSFYPVCNTRIYQGGARYFVHGGTIYLMDDDLSRNCLTRSGKKKSSRKNSFWIGLELSPEMKNLANLSFHIDFQGTDNRKKYLELLSCLEWEVQGQAISMEKGLFSEENGCENPPDMFSAYDFSRKINRSIKEELDVHFLTVKADFDITGRRETFPGELREDFPETLTAKFTDPLLWLKVNCPQTFSPEIIETVQLNINVFPVVNRQLHSLIFETGNSLPIIPLKTEENESFLSVCSVHDSRGKYYYDIPSGNPETEPSGIYFLSRGGFERYNERDAREFLVSAISLLSGEQPSFSWNESGPEKAGEKLNELIKHLKQALSASSRREVENYMLFDRSREDEIYFVEYWTTFASEANGIPAGSIFSTENASLYPQSLISLSPSCSGKDAPLAADKNSLYGKTLSTNRLLVTNEDIRDFCTKKFGTLFRDVRVRNGFVENGDSPAGFTRVTDVYLIPRQETGKYAEQEGGLFFRQMLEKNSPATFKYRVFIEN